MDQPLSPQELSAAVSDSVQSRGDIRTQVRDLTLRALQTRKLDTEGIRQVVRAVVEGIGLASERRGGEIGQAVATAVAGLDDALSKAAHATRLAVQELVSQGRDFTAQDLERALEDLKITEQALFDTLAQVADGAGAVAKRELKAAAEHLARTGSDTGAIVKGALDELGNRLSATLAAGQGNGKETARAVSVRLAETASGILAGIADALREKGGPGRKSGRD